MPIERESHHHVVFQSPLVRVFDVRVEQGDTSLFHVHADPHAGVVVSGSTRWSQTLDQPATVDSSGNPVGLLFDNAARALPCTHRVANLDSVPVRYLMGQFLGRSDIVAAPLLDEPVLKLERETSRGRMYRIRLLPGQATSSHRHAQPGLSIQMNNGQIELTGDASAAGSAHSIRNTGNAPEELIEIDWK